MNLLARNQDSLERIRAAVLSQEHTALCRITHEEVAKAGQTANVALAQGNFRGNVDFACPGTKKRRGVRYPACGFSLASLFPCLLSSLSYVLRPSYLLLFSNWLGFNGLF
jgi:hypothetical protein